MKKYKLFLILIAVSLLAAIVLGLFQQSLVLFINSLFVIGIILVVIGAWLYILDQGFFRVITYGFKKLRRHLPGFSKIKDSDEVFEQPVDDEILYTTKTHTHTQSFIWSGVLLVILSYVSLLFI
ncbi:MAG: DUF3899 domain-containing protein [Culicoidibacterales bacterium]